MSAGSHSVVAPRAVASAASLRLPAKRAASTLALALLPLATGCTQGEVPRKVLARVADIAYAAAAPASGSTAFYPRATLGDETRSVLAGAMPGATLTRKHASATLTLPSGARLELGYGLQVTGEVPAPVGFTVTATTKSGARNLVDVGVDPHTADANVWHDAKVDLSGLTGEVTLEFSTSTAVGGFDPTAGAAGTAFFSEPIVTVPVEDATTEQPPSVILISIDTLRADHLGAYGYARETSPNLDRLFSKEGVIVDRVYANAVDTLRAHASMFTGYLPTTALAPGDPLPRLAAWTLTMAEYLRGYGYRTAAFTEDAFLSAGLGFARGFERYNEETGAGGEIDTSGFVEQTFARGLAWIREHSKEPFFVFLHTYQVHYPYDPPAEYRSMFPIESSAPEDVADAANYDREIRYTDEQLGKLVASLGDAGILDHSVLIVTSDHGEEFGEHGRRYHGSDLHEETLHVPMMLRAPGILPAGARRSGPMALADLLPTLAGLLGLEKPAELEGQDLASHLAQGTPTDPVAIYHEAQTPIALTYSGNDSTWIPSSFALTTWPRRLIRIRTADGARYELYDLQADAVEHDNLYASNEKKVGFLRARLDRYQEFRSGRREDLAKSRASTSAAANAPAATAAPALTDKQREKLRALGYLQ